MTEKITPESWLDGKPDLCRDRGPFPERPYCFILLGAPGCGKGTQAELLVERFKCCQLSTGEIFRRIKGKRDDEANQTPAVKSALDSMDKGRLVSDETVIELVRERSHCLECNAGFILDGFPRTLLQAEALEEILTERKIVLDAVINYDVPVEEIVSRIEGRAKKAAEAGLPKRADDDPEIVRERLRIYNETCAPLLDFYGKKGLLVNVTAMGAPQEVFETTLSLLDKAVTGKKG